MSVRGCIIRHRGHALVMRGAAVASAVRNCVWAVLCHACNRSTVRRMLRSGGARREGAVHVRTGAVLPLASALALFCQLTHVAPPQLLKCRTCMLCSSVGAVGPTCTTRRCGACMLRSALRRVLSRAVGCWGATGHQGCESRRVWSTQATANSPGTDGGADGGAPPPRRRGRSGGAPTGAPPKACFTSSLHSIRFKLVEHGARCVLTHRRQRAPPAARLPFAAKHYLDINDSTAFPHS